MNGGGSFRLNKRAILILVLFMLLCFLYFLFGKERADYNSFRYFGRSSEISTKVDLRKLLAVAIEVAERGGLQVRQVRKDAELHVRAKGNTREGVTDPLTQGDLRSHWQMYHGIKSVFPNINVISEEHSWSLAEQLQLPAVEPLQLRYDFDSRLSTSWPQLVEADDVTVWIDPLDATKEYTENLLHYVTTMVCVAVRGRPVIGVIHQPFNATGATYWGWLDIGHSANIAPRASAPPAPSQPVKVLVSRSHAGAVEKLAGAAFKSIRKVTAAGAGFKTLALLGGAGDVYLHATLIKKWDTCAPTALLETMGGRASTLRGQLVSYAGSSPAAAAAAGHHELIEDGLLAALYNYDTYAAQVRRVLPAAAAAAVATN